MPRVTPTGSGLGAGRARSTLVNPTVPQPNPISFDAIASNLKSVAMQMHQQTVQKDKLRSLTAEAEFRQKAETSLAELDPLASNYETQANTILSEVSQEAVSSAGIETAMEQERLSSVLKARSAGLMADAAENRRKALERESLRQREQAVNGTLAQIMQDPAGADVYLAEHRAAAERYNASISPEVQRELAMDFAEQAINAEAVGYAENGDLRAATRIVEQNAEVLGPDGILKIKRHIRSVEARQRQEYLRATASTLADIQIDLMDANSQEALDAIESRVEQAHRAGMFSGREGARVSMFQAIRRQREQNQSVGEARVLADLQLDILEADSPDELDALGTRLQEADSQGLFEGRQSTRVALTKLVGQRRSAIAEGRQEVELADLETAISDAGSLPELDALRKTVDAMQEQGQLGADRQDERVSFVKQINARRRALASETEDTVLALQNYNSGTGSDSQREADLAWGALKDQLVTDPDDTDRIVDAVAEFSMRSGFVPTPIQRVVTNAERVDDPALVAQAAQIHDRIRTFTQGASTGAGDRVKAVSSYVELMGVPYDQAASLVLRTAPDQRTIEQRREVLRSADSPLKELDTDDEVRLLFPSSQFIGGGLGEADIPGSVRREYEDAVSRGYELTGDMDVSKNMAARTIRERYGETFVGTDGRRRLSPNPPERHFPGASNLYLTTEQKSLIVNSEIDGALEAMGVAPADIVGPDGEELSSDTTRYSLEPDGRTQREVDAGGRPSYQVRVRNSLGILVPMYVRDENGSIKQFRYTAPSQAELRANPEHQRIMNELRTRAEAPRRRNEDARRTFGGGSPGLQGVYDRLQGEE
ncbi:hypothetical protein [uncultured Rhodospira sp.]|uniref:hypothetical protein n=1 Tax=uncultured Rhodospira sp. TaxID=1936189 RepID=UPI002612484F|nr:hypothetical protein [uncultured Rhodospira sp.]